MTSDFHDRQDWWTMTAALAVWAAHFVAVWTFSIIFPAQPAARWIALPLTLAAWAALVFLWRRRTAGGAVIARLAIAITAGAVAFGALPALIG